MSLWDDFVQKVQGAGAAIGSTFLKAAGAQPGATIPLAQGLVEQQAIKAGMSPESAQAITDQSFNKIGLKDTEQVGTQVVTPLDKYVYQPVFQALSAGTLLINPDTWTNTDSYTEALSRAWKSRQDIPFGNAVADLAAYYSNKAPDWGPLAELNKVDIDIYNKELREKIYLRMYDDKGNRVDSQGNIIPSGTWIENAFMGLSASADIIKQFRFDPLYMGGKGFKGVRTKVLNVKNPELVVEDVTGFNKSQAKAATQTNQAYQEKLDLTKYSAELERTNKFIKLIDDGIATPVEIIREVDNMRVAEGYNPLPSDTPIVDYVKQYKNYAKSLEKEVAKRQSKIEKLNVTDAVIPTVSTGVREFINQIVSREMTWNEISKHAVIKDYAVDSEFLSKALEQAARRGENAAYDVLLLSQGDPTAAFRLLGQQKDLVKIIEDAQSRLEGLEVRIQDSLYQQDSVTAAALNLQKKKINELIISMRNDDAYLNRLIGPNSNVMATMPSMPFSANAILKGKEIAVSPIVEKWRADRAIVKAGLENGTIKLKNIVSPSQEYIWTRVQRSPLHRAVYVAQWAGHRLGREKPSGWVTTDGLDAFEGVRELRASLNDTPVFDNLPELKDKFMDDYLNAADGAAREEVLDKVELAVFEKTAAYFGADKMTKVEGGKTYALHDYLYKKFKAERAQQIENFKQDKVFAIDSNDTMISNPIVVSQLEYSRPMLDANELYKFFKYNMPTKAEQMGFMDSVKFATTKTAGGIKTIKDEVIMPTWVRVDKLWRADVLLRLGYPKRNITSELTVLAMYDRGLSGIYTRGVLTDAAKNFLNNRHAQFVDMREGYKAEIAMAKKENTPITLAWLRGVMPRRVPWTKYEEYAVDVIKELQSDKQALIDNLKEITSHPDAYDMNFKQVYESMDALDEMIAFEEANLAAISQRVIARGERFGAQKIIGKKTVRVGAHEFAGVYEGMQGKAVQVLTSSGGRLGFDISPFNAMLKEMGVETVDNWKAIYPDDKTYFLTLADIFNKQFRGSETINMILRGEPMEKVIGYLESPKGKSELERLNWIEDQPIKAKKRKAGWPLEEEFVMGQDAEGKIKTTFTKKTDQTPAENYYHFIKDEVVSTYLPTEAMRDLVRSKYKVDELGRGGEQITSGELRIAAKDAQLKPIHGQEVAEKGVAQNPLAKKASRLEHIIMEVLIKNGYKFLGEFPEDAAITHPFGNSLYLNKLGEIEEMWRVNKIMPTAEDKLRAQLVARKWTVQQTRDFLYRVTRRNGLAASMPVLAPFFQAQLSTMKRAGKLAYRNPDKAARLIWIYNQLKTNSYEDENGNKWISYTIPKEWYDDKGISGLMPEGLRNAIAANDVRRWSPSQFNLLMMGFRMPAAEVLPGQEESVQDKVARWAKAGQSVIGTGWTVQIAANQILKSSPYIDQKIYAETGWAFPARDIIEMFASPYPSEKWYDPLISAWNKRVISLAVNNQTENRITEFIFGKNNADFERTQLMQVQYHLDQQRLGLEEPLSDDPKINANMLFDQAGKEAAWNITLRLFANLTSGFISSAESSRITPLIEEYRRYQTKYGVQAYEKWLEAHPDLAYIAISRSKNLSGSSQSTDAAWLRKEHSGMIEDAIKSTGLPREDSLAFVQMVTNKNIDAAVLRDPYAGYWQRQQGDRITISAEEGYENLQVREGWRWFMDMQDDIDKALVAADVSRYSSKADKLNDRKRQLIAEYGAKNKAWYDVYSVTTGADSVVGFIRAMSVALNDEKFRESLPEDSFWFDIEEIINLREDMVQAAISGGIGAPNQAMKNRYGNEIAPYLKNPTTAYYFNKFLDSDTFEKLANPGAK